MSIRGMEVAHPNDYTTPFYQLVKNLLNYTPELSDYGDHPNYLGSGKYIHKFGRKRPSGIRIPPGIWDSQP